MGRIALAGAVFLVAGEVLARALHMVDRLNGYTRLLYMRGPDPDLPYLLRPGVETTLFGVPTRVNRHGLRGPELPATPPPGVHRILLLGDSVVFGQGLREEETVGNVLARLLDARGGATHEVVNAGIPGFDTVAEARLLEVAGLSLAPGTVVVGTSLNDYDVAPTLSPLGILTRVEPGTRPGLADRSEFVVLLRWVTAWARGRLWYQAMAHAEATRAAAPPAPPANPALAARFEQLVRHLHLTFYRDPDPVYWERLRGAMARLHRLARERDLDLLVAIFPERYQVGVPDPDLTPQRRLLGLCEETGLRCLDLHPVFAAAGGELFADAQHPNARGHAVAAAAIAAALPGGGAGGAPPG
jgi:lysophospholipase L1-like esterase